MTVTDEDGTQTRITARHAVVLATGSVPTVPRVDGLDGIEFWGTREATSAREVPESLLVLGGGVSGCELVQAYARLGTDVTLVARGDLLAKFPEPARRLVEAGLRRDGVRVRLHTATSRADAYDGGVTLSLTAAGSDGETGTADTVTGAKLLVSSGRHPALSGLGLEGLGLDPKHLGVDASGRVAGVDGGWLYAVGDAAGKAQLTHRANTKPGPPERRSRPAPPASWTAIRSRGAAMPARPTTRGALSGLHRPGGRVRRPDRNPGQGPGLSISTTELPIAVAGSSLTPTATRAGRRWWWTRNAR